MAAPWEKYQAPKPAGNATPGGGMIISDPATIRELQLKERASAIDEARLGITAGAERRQAAQSTWRTMTPQEVQKAGLSPAQRYQTNEAGKIEPIGGSPAPVDSPNRAPFLQSNLSALQNIRRLAGETLSVGEMAGRVRSAPIIGALVGQNRADLEGALSQIEGALIQDQLKELAKVNPGGVASLANSETEARRLASSIANLDPNQSQEEFLKGVARAEDYFNRQLQMASGGQAAPQQPGPDGRIVTAPGTPAAAVIGAVQGGQPILTDADRQAQQAMQAAWDKSGNPDEVVAVAAQFGRSLRPEDIEFLRANVGRPVNINANPTGTPTATQEAIGEIVATPVGESVAAAGLGAANAASFGLIDDLAPVLGLDPQRVQMAKDYLRQKAPVSSLVGEIGGGFIPAAGAIGAAGKLLAGTRAAGAAPVIGEGAFGGALAAGEAPEGERLQAGLLGTAVGAGGGALGQRLFGGPRGGGPDAGTPPAAPPAAPMGGPSGGRVSAGAAALPDDVIRVNRAAELPVPVPLANFQKTRNFVDMQRARELAKNNEVGGPIRERMAQQQAAIAANFDAFIDSTGAEVLSNLEEQGARITSGIKGIADKSKTKYRALYNRAQKAGETAEPVSYQPVLDAIAAKLPTEQDEKVLRIAREAVERNDPGKTGQLSIDAMEAVRKAVGSNMATDANQARLGGEVKGVIDDILNNAGGDVYRSARAAFREHQATFKDVGIIAQLLGTKRNSTDRVVAAENVVARILAPGTEAAQLRKMRDLVTAEGGDPQAWAEVQGAVMEQVRRAAYPASAVKDEAGNVAISPAGFKRVVDKLDQSGKLNVIFDGGTAQALRTMSDVAQDVFTAPPGSINTSNTASAWMNGLDMIINTIVAGLPLPAGVVTNVLGPVRRAAKERPLKKEVQQLIGEPTQ